MSTETIAVVGLALNALTALGITTLVAGAVKMYFLLGQHPPHSHTEKGANETLTTRGLVLPRGIKNGNP